MTKRVLPITILLLLLLQKEGVAQPYDRWNAPRRFDWWTPQALSLLPDIDSIASAFNPKRALFDFEHSLSLYKWGTSIYLSSESFSTAPLITLSAEGRSRLRQDTRVRTTEAGASLGADYPLAERSAALFLMSATSYAQDQKATTTVANIAKLSSLNDGSAALGLRHLFAPYVQAEATAGITVKSVEDRESFGPVLRSRIRLDPYYLDDDLYISSQAYLDERRYNATNEVLRNDGVSFTLGSNFADGGSNIARGGLALKRRDFFFPRDTSGELVRQERSELAFEINNQFSYPVVDNLTTQLVVNLAPRSITRRVGNIDLAALNSQFLTGTTFLAPSTSSITSTDLTAGLYYQFGTTLLSGELRYEERSETNTLSVEDAAGLNTNLSKKISDALNATSFESRSTVATVRSSVHLTPNDQLNAEVNARIYRYDTPADVNVDDRDEQYLYAILRYNHSFTNTLSLQSEARLARGHLVYLESDRSAQNNVTRTIALSNSVRYLSDHFRNTISAEVFANYTEFDFLLPSASTSDFVIRGIAASDSMYLILHKGSYDGTQWGLGIRGELRFSERGSFNAKAFSERPLLETGELLVESLLHLSNAQLSSPYLLRVGARGFLLHRRTAMSGQSSVLRLHDEERSTRIGPLVMLTLDRLSENGPRLFATLWYSFVTTFHYTDKSETAGTQAEARLAAEWRF